MLDELWFDAQNRLVGFHPVGEHHMVNACYLLGLPIAPGPFGQKLPQWITVGTLTALRKSMHEAEIQSWEEHPRSFVSKSSARLTRAPYRSWITRARQYTARYQQS